MTPARPALSPRSLAWYASPLIFCLAAYWLALKTWFFADDFAWLALDRQVHSLADLQNALFAPMAQGTVRVWSERVYFLVLHGLFGLNPIPFRIVAFLTEFANIVLLMDIARRLTRSRWAGLLAAIFWIVNPSLVIPMSWTSAYNELLCGFFLLLSFWMLLRFIESGRNAWWWAQAGVFMLGFGALELIVVYPALAALYTWICARAAFRRNLWLFVPSTLFAGLHFALISPSSDPHYQMHLDWSLLRSFWQYWSFTLSALRPEPVDWRPWWLGFTITIALSACLVAFCWKRKAGWFLLGWYVLLLAPVLPLRDHIMDYYTALPAIGIAILGGWAAREALSGTALWPRLLTLVLLCGYLTLSGVELRSGLNWRYQHARSLRNLMTALATADHSKTILLAGVSNDLFWSGFADHPFDLIGLSHVYLAPDMDGGVAKHPEWGGIGEYTLSWKEALRAIYSNRAVVYAVSSEGVRNVTPVYESILTSKYMNGNRDFVDAGDSLYARRLGRGWYEAENGFRWMSQDAVVRLQPHSNATSLHITGYCPPTVTKAGPLEVTLVANGRPLRTWTIRPPGDEFAWDLPLAPGDPMLTLTIHLSRTTRTPEDGRELGLIFGTFTAR